MSDAHPHDPEAPEVALARQVDAICRKFEADWRAGRRPAISDYLGEIAEEGRAILRRARGPRERAAPGRRGGDRRTRRSLPTSPIPGIARPSVHEDATVAPRDDATVDLGPPGSTQTEASSPTTSATSATTRSFARSLAVEWASSFRQRQVSLNRPVALKMILAGQLANDDRRQAVLHRGRGGGQPRSSRHRADLRGRPARGAALLQHGLRRGPEPLPSAWPTDRSRPARRPS